MNIGIDISVLHVARAGVFNYQRNLLQSLIRFAPDSDKFVLLDVPAIYGQTNEDLDINSLIDSRTSVRHLGGLPRWKLSRQPVVRESSFYGFSRQIDRVLDNPWDWAVETVLSRQMSKHLSDVDVFHVSDVLNLGIPGAKTVATVHDLTSLLYPEYHTDENIDLQMKNYRFAQEEADAVITGSESAKRDIMTLLGIESERIHVVYHGRNPHFRPMPEEQVSRQVARYRLHPGGYMLYVGTVEPRKNLIRLLDAYALIHDDLPQPRLKLILAGAMGWKQDEFLARLKELEVSDDIELLGRIDDGDLPALINGARVFVYPSLYEGFGLPALEAMACGTPVITSNSSSLPEVVGDAAVVVDPLDTNALAEAILDLATDANKRANLSQAGLERSQQFSWEKAAFETLDVYRKVVGAQGTGSL